MATATDLCDSPLDIVVGSDRSVLSIQKQQAQKEIQAFSLLPRNLSKGDAINQATQLCHVRAIQVVDIWPCTPLQEGLISCTAQRPGAYVAHQTFRVASGTNIERLRNAWIIVAARNPILRTRIASLNVADHSFMAQIVLDEEIIWNDMRKVENSVHREHSMELGTTLSRFELILDKVENEERLIWEIHHSLYDAWSMSLILAEVESMYRGIQAPQLHSMAIVAQYLQSHDDVAERAFWAIKFENAKGTHFPSIPLEARPRPNGAISVDISDLQWSPDTFTPATIVKSAWSIAIANAIGSKEALFGMIVNGRQASLHGIDLVAGPTIATVPMRVHVNWDGTFHDCLSSMHEYCVEMIPYEHSGLQKIASINENTAFGCKFQSLLVVQPPAGDDHDTPGVPTTCLDDISQDSDLLSDPYAIVLECQLRMAGAHFEVAFDSSYVSIEQINYVMHSFEVALMALSKQTQRNQRLDCLKDISWDLHQIWTWNVAVPSASENCVTDLISVRVQGAPSALAVDAWDGSFTYAELDQLSTRLACHLVTAGAVGKIVPILFEKSKWTPIASVAVMKAGAVCLALDSTQPSMRLQSLVDEAKASLIVCSTKNENFARDLGITAPVLVGSAQEWTLATEQLPVINPSDTLYVNFTSGSTGTPKGALVTHRNFCSAIKYQQKELRFNETSRVLDFSSYSFDVTWANCLHSLTCGGCLCIPSQEERDNDLAGTLERYQINHVDLTPSVARIIGKDPLSRLSTLLLGGEAIVGSDSNLTPEGTKIFNVYGPAECTPTTVLTEVTKENIMLGKGAGVCTWVVNPETCLPSQIGDVGELWLEGPLVGEGYLNDQARTEQCFLESPQWLKQGLPAGPGRLGKPGRHGRIYRTGDMVRYSLDGTLTFIGRRDRQVKIRGQRIELQEVEQYIQKALPQGVDAHVLAEVVQPDHTNIPVLVAFVTLNLSVAMPAEIHNAAVERELDGLRSRLALLAPGYMMPSVFVPLSERPMLISNKIDHGALQKLGIEAFERYMNLQIQPKDEGHVNEAEAVLQQVWQSVLNLSAEEISVTAGFVSLGGDSISAMQVVSRSKLHNLIFTVSDLFQASNIRNLATACQARASIMQESGTEPAAHNEMGKTDHIHLSPIQQMYFDMYPDGCNHWNQSFLFQLRRPVAAHIFREAVTALVKRHTMLRSRFVKSSPFGNWMQYTISENHPDTFAFVEHPPQEAGLITRACQHRQESLNLTDGPVFACDLLQSVSGENFVLLSSHHVVVDLVSWRIIWNDLEDFISHGKLLSQPTLSFHEWCRRQARGAVNLSPLSVLPYTVPSPPAGFWGDAAAQNKFADCRTYVKSFDQQICDDLFGESNKAYHTEPLDIIHGTLLHSFLCIFSERAPPVIWFEGHGREDLSGDPVDTAETVGWFTTIHPRPLSIDSDTSVIDAIRFAKDRRRQIPGKGQPYFACRYLSDSGREAFRSHEDVEVTLNFVGRFQQIESEEGLFGKPDGKVDSFTEVSPQAQRFSMVEINAEVDSGELVVEFHVNKNMKYQERLQAWIELFEQTLQAATRNLIRSSPGLTVSDLPLLSLSHSHLDWLLGGALPKIGIKPHEIADIHPCSPMQQGILISAQKQASSYMTSSIWRCTMPFDDSPVSSIRLADAWRAVVRRHTCLRSIFTLNPDGSGFIQIVLKKYNANVKIITVEGKDPTAALKSLEPTLNSVEPEHMFTIYESQTGELACKLNISHALIDASTMAILIKEIISLYGESTLPAPRPFSEVIRCIQSTSVAQRMNYWKSRLHNTQPCIFPIASPPRVGSISQKLNKQLSVPSDALAGVAEFCRARGITRSVFIQVAWSLVLSYFTGQHKVCFGYLANGRDLSVDGIDGIVGPLSNLLIACVDLDESPDAVFETTWENSVKNLDMQHVSLADVQHQLGLPGKLFNSVMSLQASDQLPPQTKRTLQLEPCQFDDPNEFDVSITAGVDGDKIDVQLELLDPEIAEEVRDLFVLASRFLLSAEASSDDNSLAGYFFKYHSGVDLESATCFWQRQFAGTQGFHYPSFSVHDRVAKRKDKCFVIKEFDLLSLTDFPTASTVLQAGWAILVHSMTGCNEALFGTLRQANSVVVPARIPVHPEASVQDFLKTTQDMEIATSSFAGCSVRWIKSVSEEAALACAFNTVLCTTLVDATPLPNALYGLIVELQPLEKGTKLRFSFDSLLVTAQTIVNFGCQLGAILQQLSDRDFRQRPIGDLLAANTSDVEKIWSWNMAVPKPIGGNVHSLLTEMAHKHSAKTAICAWDGELTYREFDELSSTLAGKLIERGVRRGSYVPLIFEKSMWMPVAALAVWKAGGATVAIDPSTQPEQRIRSIIKKLDARISLSSASKANLASSLRPYNVVVTTDLLRMPYSVSALPETRSSDVAYVIFTSGSTGNPKGTVISHGNLRSALAYQSTALGFTKDARVLDFASYAFDVAWSNLLNCLAVGACMCIPSAEERDRDLSGALKKYNANLLDLAPSIARQLSVPKDLSTLILGGEAIVSRDKTLVSGATSLKGAYGPAECTPTAMILDLSADGQSELGRGHGLCTWIVDVHNPNRLAPIGARGELWLEGPLVGLGYLNDAEKTTKAFVQDPPWLLEACPGRYTGRSGRTFRTGDLVRYKDDGSLEFLGRRDNQVKLRGQRIELDDVEMSLSGALHELDGSYKDVQVIAIVAKLADTKVETLVAYVLDTYYTASLGSDFRRIAAEASKVLSKRLPRYMVPAAIIPINQVPRLPTGKIDRARLQAQGGQLSTQQIAESNRVSVPHREPRTPTERLLRETWASILNVDKSSVGIDDHFFALGASSITAMKMANMTGLRGLSMTLGEVFKFPVLQDLAAVLDRK